MGPECYGTIENAFRGFLADAAKLPDNGESIRRAVYGELLLICDSPQYIAWVESGFRDPEIIRLVGGRFVQPYEIGPLLRILDSDLKFDS
jgi:hypothetical protein